VQTYRWSDAKNKLLRAERAIAFEDMVTAITAGLLLRVFKQRSPEKYPRKSVFMVELNRYV
jgi:hypothetical protein